MGFLKNIFGLSAEDNSRKTNQNTSAKEVIVKGIYDKMNKEMAPKMFYGGLDNACKVLISMAEAIYGDENVSRNQLMLISEIYVQLWVRRHGGFDPSFSEEGYIRERMKERFSQVDPEALDKAIDIGFDFMKEHERQGVQGFDEIMQKKDESHNSASEYEPIDIEKSQIMGEKRDELDVILRKITGGLTGDAEHDGPYLMEQIEKYKSHELAKEIVRACGRLLYNVIPEGDKEKIAQLLDNVHLGVDATLDEVKFNIYKRDFKKAQTILEDLIRKIEKVDAYQDDIASEYHTFNEPFEDVLYRFRTKPEKEVRQADIRYSEIYYHYGAILVELKDFEKAKAALRTALKWNPMSTLIHFEYAEVFKMTEDYEEFFRLTVEAFKIAFRSADIARCYRNLGFYFIEKELYPEAAGCYFMSILFEPDSKQAMSELYYISTKTNKEAVNPTKKEMEKYSNKYGFPLGPDDDVVGLSVATGKHCYEQKDYDLAWYFWSITYDLTKNEEIKKKLDEIKQRMN